MRMKLPLSRMALLLAASLLLPARTASAEDIRVMTSGAFTAAYLELIPRIEAVTREKVVTVTTSMGLGADSIPSRIQRGEAVDVVILPDATIEELIKGGLVVAGSRVALARSGIGMAVRAGAPKPDISSVDALRRTLLQARSIAYSASVSGTYLSTELFDRLGIADQVKGKSRRIERERVGAVVARGEAEIGFQQISELLPVPGVDYVGPLPPEAQRMTVISAGVVSASRNPDAARALIRFLASPDAASVVTKSGMEPIAGPAGAVSVAQTKAAAAIDAEDQDKLTQLMRASAKGDVAMVNALLQKGANPNTPSTEQGVTALMFASYFGHIDVVKALVAKGARIDLKDRLGAGPIDWAIVGGHMDVEKLFMDKGAAPNPFFGVFSMPMWLMDKAAGKPQ